MKNIFSTFQIFAIFIILLINLLFNFIANRSGKNFYKKRIKDNCKYPKIYDKFFSILPDYSENSSLPIIIDLFLSSFKILIKIVSPIFISL